MRARALDDPQDAEMRGAREEREEQEDAQRYYKRGHPDDSLGPGLATKLIHGYLLLRGRGEVRQADAAGERELHAGAAHAEVEAEDVELEAFHRAGGHAEEAGD